MPFEPTNRNLAQVCFANDANLEQVKSQLLELHETTDYMFVTCFLPRHVVEEKGFDTTIIDLLDSCLGDRHQYYLKDCEDFNHVMKALPEARKRVADAIQRMYVLDSGTAEGIRKEIDLFIGRKLVMMP